MKKSTILSLATAGAIVATSLGTFAAWDTTTAKNSGTLTVGSPVTISTPTAATYQSAASRTLGETPAYSSDVTFNVAKQGQTVSKLNIDEVAVYETDSAVSLADQFDITVVAASGNTGVAATPETGAVLTDESVDEGANAYTVTLTPKNDSVQGKTLHVDVTASIK